MIYRNNLITADWTDVRQSDTYSSRQKFLTPRTGAFNPRLGLSLHRLEPGKRALPDRGQNACDEVILVLDGSGSLRVGEELLPLKQGDYLHFTIDNGQTHQIINDGDQVLDYLSFSTMIFPDTETEVALNPPDSL